MFRREFLASIAALVVSRFMRAKRGADAGPAWRRTGISITYGGDKGPHQWACGLLPGLRGKRLKLRNLEVDAGRLAVGWASTSGDGQRIPIGRDCGVIILPVGEPLCVHTESPLGTVVRFSVEYRYV